MQLHPGVISTAHTPAKRHQLSRPSLIFDLNDVPKTLNAMLQFAVGAISEGILGPRGTKRSRNILSRTQSPKDIETN